MQPNTPQSSPYQLNLGDPLSSGTYVGLRPGAYDPGYTTTSCYAILNGDLAHIEVSAHHVELVNGASGGKKIAVISVNGVELAKLNVPGGQGIYGLRGLDVQDTGTVTVDACANDGPPLGSDPAHNPTLLWHQSTLTGAPLAGIKRLTKANLAALVGSGGGGVSQSDFDALKNLVNKMAADAAALYGRVSTDEGKQLTDEASIAALQAGEANEGQTSTNAHYVLTKNGTVVYQD